MDLIQELDRVDRTLGSSLLSGKLARVLTLTRAFDASVPQVWRAVTKPRELAQWFSPVQGAIQPGGLFIVPDRASGVVQECAPMQRVAVTWSPIDDQPQADASLIELELRPLGPRTQCRLVYWCVLSEVTWHKFGPGSVGVMWDLALVGLAAYLAEASIGSLDELLVDSGMRDVIALSSEAWGRAAVAAGANATRAAHATAATSAFFVPPLDA